MYKKHKGFTLIELLAVIIILAIVALIATPIILNVVDDAKKSAGKSEANMILSGINNYCATEDVKSQMDEDYINICTSGLDAEKVKEMVNLGNATIDKIVYNGDKLTELEITSNNHKFTLCPSGTFAMDDEECDYEVGLVGTQIIEKAKNLVYDNNNCKTDGTTYNYMGGCYIKGNPNNNYIWYSGFLWRIMGINADGTVRLITDENVTGIPWGAENTAQNWDESYAKDWLNNYFYPKLKGNNIIVKQRWCNESTENETSERTICASDSLSNESNIGLLTLDEYNLSYYEYQSYLNIHQFQWVITPYDSSYVWYISQNGGWRDNYGTLNKSISSGYGIRPIINVNSSSIITGGNGTIVENWNSEAGPYILNEDKNVEIKGKLNEKTTSGEYVLFAERKYRVVDKDSDGNIKLILDEFYKENDKEYNIEFGNSDVFSINDAIGQKLNVDVLNWLTNNNAIEKGKLVSNYTWYQNRYDYGENYKISLEEKNPTRVVQATVGLIRVGEMLAGQSSSILTENYTTFSSYNNASYYWTITPSYNNNFSDYVWSVINHGNSGSSYVTYSEIKLRPVIVIKSDVEITGGNGTWSKPYQI